MVVLLCILLDRASIAFDAAQPAVEFRVEDPFISVFGYLDLRLRFFVKSG